MLSPQFKELQDHLIHIVLRQKSPDTATEWDTVQTG